MRHITPLRTGVAVGTVIALWHLMWAALVGTGYARTVMDFILKLHFIDLQYRLEPYSVTTAAILVALTFAIGMLFGFAFAVIWNWLTVEGSPTWARDITHPAPAE